MINNNDNPIPIGNRNPCASTYGTAENYTNKGNGGRAEQQRKKNKREDNQKQNQEKNGYYKHDTKLPKESVFYGQVIHPYDDGESLTKARDTLEHASCAKAKVPEVQRAFRKGTTLVEADIVISKLVYPHETGNRLVDEAAKREARSEYQIDRKFQKGRWRVIDTYIKNTYEELETVCHPTLLSMMKRSSDWEGIEQKQDLFGLWKLIVATCQAGGSTDQVDTDINCIALSKRLLNFQQQSEAAEYIKKLGEIYDDLFTQAGPCPFGPRIMQPILSAHGITWDTYFDNAASDAATINECNDEYKQHFIAKLAVANCKSSKLRAELANKKMFGIDNYPVRTAESCIIIQRYDELDLQDSRKSENESASDGNEYDDGDDSTSQLSAAISIDDLNSEDTDTDTATILSNASTEDRDQCSGSDEEVNSDETDYSEDNADGQMPEITTTPPALASDLGSYWQSTGSRRRTTSEYRNGNANYTDEEIDSSDLRRRHR